MDNFLIDFEKFIKKVDEFIPGDWIMTPKCDLAKIFIENYTEIKKKEIEKHKCTIEALKTASKHLNEQSCNKTAPILNINSFKNLSLILSFIIFINILILILKK
ncbi:MAG: hypothetical protein MJH09_10330 [Cetobacterium sp.]|nr:hypothetical protein [Cetobacterium sp.]